jgi:outer membrane autotransporter protein
VRRDFARRIDDFDTTLGYVGARLGTAFATSSLAFQPYVAASLWRQFAGNINGTLVCNTVPTCPTASEGNTMQASVSQIGTFGQFGVGVAGQLLKTGLVGYVRADLRDGSGYEAHSFTGGLRYSF